MRSFSSIAAAIAICLASSLVTPAAQPARRMAITIDDGPFVNGRPDGYLQHAQAMTDRYLRALREHGATAVLFVNEQQLEAGDADEQVARTALLERWVADGHVLGNHTFSHPDANRLTAESYQEDIAKGERVTLRLMANRGAYQKYFRHPFTHTGETAEKKTAIAAFLASRGYVVTPHTAENADWMFNRPFVRAADAGDARERTRIGDAYVAYTLDVVTFAEEASMRVFGREIPQVLLLHANDVTGAHLDALLARLSARGYRFVTLDEAMRDEAYRTPDTWVGRAGPTWLFRWSRSLGRSVSFAGEPEPPAWLTP